jgi:hypothetical protein
MPEFNQKAKRLANSLFSKSEVQNRISLNAVKMIIGDVVTLYTEFRKADGIGALFFNPQRPDDSQYLTLSDIHKDIALAEELMNEELCDFLKKLVNLIQSESENESPIVVMIDQSGMSVHVIDLNLAEEMITQRMKDAISGV